VVPGVCALTLVFLECNRDISVYGKYVIGAIQLTDINTQTHVDVCKAARAENAKTTPWLIGRGSPNNKACYYPTCPGLVNEKTKVKERATTGSIGRVGRDAQKRKCSACGKTAVVFDFGAVSLRSPPVVLALADVADSLQKLLDTGLNWCARRVLFFVVCGSATTIFTRVRSDVTLVVEGQEIFAHRLILAARSPVFAAMFSHKMVESRENVVRLEDISEPVFRQLLKFMYTGQCSFYVDAWKQSPGGGEVRQSNMPLNGNSGIDCKSLEPNSLVCDITEQLFVAADRFQVATLSAWAVERLITTVTADNAAERFEFAERFGLPAVQVCRLYQINIVGSSTQLLVLPNVVEFHSVRTGGSCSPTNVFAGTAGHEAG
jgi:hypothetical protein